MSKDISSNNVTRSAELFEQAQQFIPGGVNSPVRAFRGVGGNPLFFSGGEGAWLIDADGNRYIDYVGAWGPLILGHRCTAGTTVSRPGIRCLHRGGSGTGAYHLPIDAIH